MLKRLFFLLTIISFIGIIPAKAQVDTKLSRLKYDSPKEYEIGGITISGIQYLDQNALVHLSGLKVGEKIKVPGDDITKSVKKLWKHGLFGDVKISATKIIGNRIFLEIYLKERPRLSKFRFNGISKSDADDLREDLNLIRGSQVTDNVINVAKSKIKAFYVEKGYLNASCEIVQNPDTLMPNTVVLDFNIDKKERVKIDEIVFVGNTVFKEGKLFRSLKETKRKRWYNLFKPSKYREKIFEEDKLKLIAKYNELGYRDAKILSDSIAVRDDKTITLYIRIHEGKKYYFREIEWIGNTKYPSEFLAHRLGIGKGDVFDQAVLDKKLFGEETAVSSLYLDNGYLFFQAIPVETNVDNDSIDLEIRIFEGKQARINDIRITGNTRTNEHVIRREIVSKPGELFSRADLIQTNRLLAALGYFDPEKININPVPDPVTGTVDLEFGLEERASDQIELSGGYGAKMFIGTLGLSFTNFSAKNIFNWDTYSPLPTGDGQKLSLRGQTNGKYYSSFNASFTEPWLGGKKPNSLTVSFFFSKRSGVNYYQMITGGGEYDASANFMNITGASVGLGRRLRWPDYNFTLYNELSFQHYYMNNYQQYTGFKAIDSRGNEISFRNGRASNLTFTTVVGRNSTDQPLYPRRGSNMSLSLQVTPPYSLFKTDDYWVVGSSERSKISKEVQDANADWTDAEVEAEVIARAGAQEVANKFKFVEYHKWKFKSDWYTEIFPKFVLRTNVEFGYLGYYKKSNGYSPFETFQLGGDGMSGFYGYYGTDIVPLRGYSNGTQNDGSLTDNPQSNVYNKYVLELRYPLTLSPSATIYALAFLEAGNSWYSPKDMNPFEMHRSAGAGLRFFLPMFGLLGIDWGYGFDPVPGQKGASGGHFAFTIGQQF